ncbi:LytR C-terminal domain-containing protein [Cellulomonas sp. DKR-3]|uniref:LytR C-terminal domain-containing protein n=1 Tax=Cellulomonas fulva TaxID=2835530 RepID=A0ABS5TVH6_9CELL|nr:LytR C-terminal domain-containing protein [Cellulomonas fulva]MBT0993136.1 LytR C-terminal domain-containing protein [Cellulomonas fulva]
MSKADYPYPDDEFDAPPDPTAPRGVHRAPRSAWSRWWPFVAVLVIAPLLAYAIVTFASRDQSTDDGSAAAPTTTSAPTSAATGGASEEPSDEASEPADETSEPADEETTPTAEADLSTPVTVYNGAGIQGLAGAGAGQLTEAGFTSVTADNFSGTAPATSTVYYATEDQAGTAELVASTLGLTTVTLDAAQAGSGIVVVLTEALPS